jgi:poly(beta-D-mannuronate) lyase
LKASGIYGLASTSPAIDQASSSSYPAVTKDIDGQTRSGMKDTGADEYSTASIVNRPLKAGDVGPSSP